MKFAHRHPATLVCGAVGVAALFAVACEGETVEGLEPQPGGGRVPMAGSASTAVGQGGAVDGSAGGGGPTAGGPDQVPAGPGEGQGGAVLQGGSGGGTPGEGAGGSAPAADAGADPEGSDPEGSVPPSTFANCEPAQNPQVPNLGLQPIAQGLQSPTLVVAEPLEQGATELPAASRMYVVEQGGTVRLIVDDQLQPGAFLDISDRTQTQGERGLLGMALHPSFQSNGKLYVNYSAVNVQGVANGTTIVSEFTVDLQGSPDQVDPGTERIVLTVAQPQNNHNGGNVLFGPDGYLYIGMGDGGGGNDANHGPIGNGQNLDALLGKILRIDVDVPAGSQEPYLVPADNPFVGQQGADEIWSYGWRNPWRFAFDPCTGDMYVADVGQNALEEVDFEPASTPGLNYGWRCAEGTNQTNNACPGVDTSTFVGPVTTYGRNLGFSITGGFVYRGSAIPDLRGTYLYADYVSAEFFALRMQGGELAAGSDQIITGNLNAGGQASAISSFGQDNAGEMYVVSYDGTVFRIVPGQ